jgi:hypothetical protein
MKFYRGCNKGSRYDHTKKRRNIMSWKLEFAISPHDEKTTDRNRICKNVKSGNNLDRPGSGNRITQLT